jgi:hypothetical protein
VNALHPLPPYRVIERALRLTTETLAREIAAPTATAPSWNDFEWAVARAVCAMQGIGALLASQCRWPAPKAWLEFLRDQQDHGLAHFEHAGDVLARLDVAMSDAGLPCIALKGSALRGFAVHAPGVRPMGDIDLLVSPDHVAACATVLDGLGYELHYSTVRHHIFHPKVRATPHAFAEHTRNPLRIEVHTRIAESLPITQVEITQLLWPARLRPGINPYANRAALMRHLMLHTAGNMRAHAMRLTQVNDIARFAQRFEPDDWRELRYAAPESGSWWMYPPLRLAARYLPGCVPDEALAAFRSICPAPLRRRADRYSVYDVSWSNLRIGALPGHEWSRSPLELMRYAKSRAIPSRTALDELVKALEARPDFACTPWYGISHGQRIVRWLFSRPPRVQTLTSVRAAVEDATWTAT